MRRWISAFCCFVAWWFIPSFIGCRGKNPVAPSGSAPTANVVLVFNQAVHREAGKFSLTVKGQSSSDELINALPLVEPLRTNESWSGAVMRLLSFNAGWSGTTNVPFTPPSHDHFQFDDVPSDGNSIDISLELIPGGQPICQPPAPCTPFHNIRLALDNSHVKLPSGYSTSNIDGRVHVKGPLPK